MLLGRLRYTCNFRSSKLMFLFLACASETAFLSTLPDQVLSASSSYRPEAEPSQSRLFTLDPGNNGGSWEASIAQYGEWIQCDLLTMHNIYKVATQGRNGQWAQWVTSYYLKYSATSDDDSEFQFVLSAAGNSRLFSANTDQDSVVVNRFYTVHTRYVRLYPVDFHGAMSLRWEVYGCSNPTDCPAIEIANSVLSTAATVVGTDVSISCESGFSFGSTHYRDTAQSTCTDSVQWQPDVNGYSCDPYTGMHSIILYRWYMHCFCTLYCP